MIERHSERGITIIETTVILSVLFILAGAMSPIVSESVTTARAVKAKNDASMIAMGLINLQKDLGGDALAYGGAGVAGAMAVRASDGLAMASAGMGSAGFAAPTPMRLPGVLASAGDPPQTEDAGDGVGHASMLPVLNLFVRSGAASSAEATPVERRQWRETPAESLDDHLRTNRKGYRLRRPGEYGGWNGPYVSAELKGDPWGNQFLVNSQWLDGGSTAADGEGRPRRAVFVISAGNNGIIETPFEQPIIDARAYGDDIVIRIQ
ncbi:MAG: hypothetical protein HYU37_12880 [Acidobacteria bacterium]|nr:hypothetical protein [Acidobacteriota bacterium]